MNYHLHPLLTGMSSPHIRQNTVTLTGGQLKPLGMRFKRAFHVSLIFIICRGCPLDKLKFQLNGRKTPGSSTLEALAWGKYRLALARLP